MHYGPAENVWRKHQTLGHRLRPYQLAAGFAVFRRDAEAAAGRSGGDAAAERVTYVDDAFR